MKAPLTMLFAALLVLGSGCSSDPEQPNIPPSPYRSLQAHDDVLFNLELAYNKSNFSEYDKLLDDNFVFNFSTADVQYGNVQVAHWDRANELAATANLFNQGTLPQGVDPISDISLNLYFSDGGDNWEAIAPSDPQQYPGETWYRQRVDYFLSVTAGENVYTSGNPLKAEFTIRPVDDNGTTVWRIIAWRDLGANTVMAATAFVETSTWGQVKSLYR